ncbi:hypothetical protein AaE_014050 [Aphanomyces astaci]|uniref:Uncharacterized protein n=1 Tax=Aphanomyces astaci TaxID=112090 RepID=A0A6A4Z1R4_APHAT|nr:hypothetical protein AaE_014050 [Aphanomyces astaci]
MGYMNPFRPILGTSAISPMTGKKYAHYRIIDPNLIPTFQFDIMDSTTAVCVAVVAAALVSIDELSSRAPVINTVVVPSTTWQQVKSDGTYDGWFTRHLRCTHHIFLRIANNTVLLTNQHAS